MKNYNLLIPALALIVTVGACQNRSTNTTDSANQMMQHGDSSMTMDSSSTHAMESNEMMNVMSGMMDDMKKMTMTGNADVDFARMMKGHHQAAVDMAAIELKSGEDATPKQMAQKITDDQKAEIKELNAFMDAHKNAAKNYDPSKKDMGFAKVMESSMMSTMDMAKMDGHMAASTDDQFANCMKQHHQGAIDLAKGYIQYGKDAKLISMAKKMIADQKKEIDAFNKWNDQHK